MEYYVKFEDKFKFIYSLDMIRLNFDLNINYDVYIKEFYDYMLCHSIESKFYLGRGIGYRYLYSIQLSSCSFAIGFCLNSKGENKNRGFIEFNPNKCCQQTEFIDFYNWLVERISTMELVRYDVAIDLPIVRENVKLIRTNSSKYEFFENYSNVGLVMSRSITEYMGQRNHNKFTKLYDKKAESGLDYNLTRIEFTFCKSEEKFENLARFFVYDIRICPQIDFSIFSSTDLVLIDLLRNSSDINLYLHNLPYKKVKKILPLLNDFEFSPDIENLLKVRREALKFEI